MSLRAGAPLLAWSILFISPVGCGGNADDFPIPEAGPPEGDPDGGAGTGGSNPTGVDAAGEEEDAPPSACPVIRPLRVSDAPGVSREPAILWNGTNYLVVWADERNGGSDIFGTLLSRDGQRVAGMSEQVLVDTAQSATSPEIVKLPPPAEGYLLVYENCEMPTATDCAQGSVGAVVLGADGKPTGAPITISPAVAVQRRPYLATGHGNVYVAYRDRTAATATEMARTVARVTRLDSSGMPVEPMITLDEASDGLYPHVAVSPDRVAVVYRRDKPEAQIALALFNPALTLERELVVRPGFDAEATNPVVQWNDSRWVVAWEDEREGEAAIFATVATADGSTVQPPQRAYDENGNWPTIASGGMMTSLIGFYGYPGRRVFLARLQASGMLKPGQVVIDHGSFPAVTYNEAADEYAVVYQSDDVDEIMFARFKCAD